MMLCVRSELWAKQKHIAASAAFHFLIKVQAAMQPGRSMSSISSDCTMEVAHDPGHAGKASKRGKANLRVTDVQYKHALYECLVADPPLLDMRSKLGPRLCAHVKQVEPGHLMAVHKAWMPLINNGCKNLVLQSKQCLQHCTAWHLKTVSSSRLAPHCL